MRFKDWLKGAKAKAFVFLGSFAMLLGLGASIYSVKAAMENEVVETKAYSQQIPYGVFVKQSESGTTYATLSYSSTTGNWTGDATLNSGTTFYIIGYVNGGYKQAGYCGEDKSGLYNTPGIYHDSSRKSAICTSTKGKFSFTVNDADLAGYGDSEWIWQTNSSISLPSITVTYQYKSTDNGTVKTSTSVTAYRGSDTTLPNSSVANFKFYGWYTNYSSGVFSGTHRDGGATYTVPDSNTTLYGRYVASGYGYFLSSNYSWNPTSSVRFTDNSPSTGWRKKTRSIALNEEFYLFYCNASSTDGNYHHSNLKGGDAAGNFSDSGGNFKCGLAGSYDIILDTGTGNVYIYYSPYTTDTGYRMVGTGSFTTGTAWAFSAGLPMVSSGAGLGTNTAVLANGTTGIPVTSGSQFRVYKHDGIASLTAYSMTLGGTYTSFAADRGDNIEITKTGSYNFYFKIDNGTNYIYIVDVSEIANAGTLYFSSSESDINEISVTTTNTEEDPQNPFDDDPLGDVSGAQKLTTTVKFNGNYIYSVPIFNLRGDDSGSPISDVTFSWSGGSIVISALTAIGGSGQQYYLIGSGTAASKASATEYTSLKLALDIETEINGATDKSACNVAKATAAGLVTRYGSASKTYLDSATINTYDPDSVTLSNLNTSTSPKADVAISVIMSKTLGPISRGEDPSPSLVLPNGQQESSPLTLTLWIVLGAGVLGMGAIGTAYFASKRKKTKSRR